MAELEESQSSPCPGDTGSAPVFLTDPRVFLLGHFCTLSSTKHSQVPAQAMSLIIGL